MRSLHFDEVSYKKTTAYALRIFFLTALLESRFEDAKRPAEERAKNFWPCLAAAVHLSFQKGHEGKIRATQAFSSLPGLYEFILDK